MRVNQEVTGALALPKALEVLKGDGVAPGPPEQFGAQIKPGLAPCSKVAREAGVKPQ